MTPNDKAMHVFWAVAEALMERFDRSVCDIQVDGVAMPTFPQEHVLVNRNTKRTLNAMHRSWCLVVLSRKRGSMRVVSF